MNTVVLVTQAQASAGQYRNSGERMLNAQLQSHMIPQRVATAVGHNRDAQQQIVGRVYDNHGQIYNNTVQLTGMILDVVA